MNNVKNNEKWRKSLELTHVRCEPFDDQNGKERVERCDKEI